MPLTSSDLQTLAQHAISAAKAAGLRITEAGEHDRVSWEKNTGTSRASSVVTAIDLACDQLIYEHLSEVTRHYNLGYLSEEREDDQSRFEADYFWCVDPLDGTLPFIEKPARISRINCPRF